MTNLQQIIDKDGNNLSLKGENWRQVDFSPITYVSDKGRVYSVTQKKIRKLDIVTNKYGSYHRISLRINGENVHFQLGRLVGMIWCEGYSQELDKELEIHHCNGDSLDDAASNLEWLDEHTHDLVHRLTNAYKRAFANRLKELTENGGRYDKNN